MAVPIHPFRIHRPDIKRFAVAAGAIVAAAVAITGIQAITNNDPAAPSTEVIVVNPAVAAAATHSPVAAWAMAGGLTGLSPASVGPVVDSADQPTSDTETSKIVTLEDELRAIHAGG